MKMMQLTRRGFLRAACVVAGGAMISRRMAGVAVARFRDIRDYMLDRIHGVYGADAAFPVRASQDNAQVRELYAAYLKRPLGPLSEKLLQKKDTEFIGKRLHLIPVTDGESKEILNKKVTFFDIQSTKTKQFGFCREFGNGEKLTCCGDEPYHPCEEKYAKNSTWLLHEAFCMSSQAEIFHPYEKHHSTVKDACELAEKLHVKNLLLYHTED